MDKVKLIDISSYQGSISFAAVKDYGIRDVIIKCTEGTSSVSPTFDSFYLAAKSVGMNVGAYHFLKAVTPDGAREEAKFFLSKLGNKQFELPLALDVETLQQLNKLPTYALVQVIDAFMQVVERAGYYVVLYMPASYLEKLSNEFPDELDKYDKWVAHWDVERPAYFGSYGIWQYGSGYVNGIQNKVDLNWCYKDYPSIIKSAGLNNFNIESDNSSEDVDLGTLKGAISELAELNQKMGQILGNIELMLEE